MNRIGVVTSVLDAVPSAYTKGQLALIDTKGGIVKTGSAGPYAPPSMIEFFVGLTDGTSKHFGTLNPSKFAVSSKAYEAAVGKTVRVGYDGTSGSLVCIDPTLTANIGKFGTLSITYNDLTSLTIPSWGNVFQQDIQIAAGETTTTLYAKLQAAATALAAKINAKYGAGTVTFTSGAPVINAASSYLQFVFAAGKTFSVTLDDIFDGTPIAVTAGADGPIVSGLTGAEVIDREKEAAVLDGYNPNQVDKYQLFNIDNYVGAAVGTNYDCVQIRTTLPKEYEAPDSPSGWDVLFEIFCPNTTPGTLGTVAQAIVDLLTEVNTNQSGFLTQAVADTLYAPHA